MNRDIRTALIIGAIVLAVIVVVPLFWGWGAGCPGGGMMGGMMGPGMMGGFGWGPLGLIFTILFWGLIIWGLIALVRGLNKNGAGPRETNSALDILKSRYARGEIRKEEFEEKKKDLL